MTLIELQEVLGDRIRIAIDTELSIEDRWCELFYAMRNGALK